MFDNSITIGSTVVLNGGMTSPKMMVINVLPNYDINGAIIPLSEANQISLTWFVNGLQYSGAIPLGCLVKVTATTSASTASSSVTGS